MGPSPNPSQRLGLGRLGSLRELTNLNDIILFLEDSACQGALVTVVQPVRICSVLDEEADEVGVTVVGGEHELQVTSLLDLRVATLNGERWIDGPVASSLRVAHTKVSPFSLVILGGKPAWTAC